MHSKWSLLLVLMLVVALFGCGASENESPESPEPTKDPFGASTGGAMGQPSNEAMSQMQNQQPAEMVYLTSPDQTSFIIFVPKPDAETNFKVTDIVWIKNGVPQRKPSFKYSDLSEGDIFWEKYSSKWDIKVKLDKPVASWGELVNSDIIKVLEHDLGKNNNIKMTEDWYFTKTKPTVDSSSG
jgi:hypothetical protein